MERSNGTQAPTAAVGSPVKTKAKKVPRYVKEALQEVEQEKAKKLAAEQAQAPAQMALQKTPKVGKASKATKQHVQAKQPAKKGKLADSKRMSKANR